MDSEEIVKGTVVYKMSASGNDFVMVDGRTSPIEDWTAERIQEVCARRTGIGADGVAVIEPGSGPGAIRFVYFNKDGHLDMIFHFDFPSTGFGCADIPSGQNSETLDGTLTGVGGSGPFSASSDIRLTGGN